MTYAEVIEWLEDSGFFDGFDLEEDVDLGELYETISANWEGRSSFEDIMSVDEFINEVESRYS
jgi:hypothetical protein